MIGRPFFLGGENPISCLQTNAGAQKYRPEVSLVRMVVACLPIKSILYTK